MKTKIIIIIAVFVSAFSACRKCETCSAFYKSNGQPAPTAQTVYVCRKAEIKAYETGNNFITPAGDSVYFTCVDTAF